MDSVTVHRAENEECSLSLSDTLSFSLSAKALRSSPILHEVFASLISGSSETIQAPHGYLESWIRFSHGQLLCRDADDTYLLSIVKVCKT